MKKDTILYLVIVPLIGLVIVFMGIFFGNLHDKTKQECDFFKAQYYLKSNQ